MVSVGGRGSGEVSTELSLGRGGGRATVTRLAVSLCLVLLEYLLLPLPPLTADEAAEEGNECGADGEDEEADEHRHSSYRLHHRPERGQTVRQQIPHLAVVLTLRADVAHIVRVVRQVLALVASREGDVRVGADVTGSTVGVIGELLERTHVTGVACGVVGVAL